MFKALHCNRNVHQQSTKLHLSSLTEELFLLSLNPRKKHEYDIFFIVNKPDSVPLLLARVVLCVYRRQSKPYILYS